MKAQSLAQHSTSSTPSWAPASLVRGRENDTGAFVQVRSVSKRLRLHWFLTPICAVSWVCLRVGCFNAFPLAFFIQECHSHSGRLGLALELFSFSSWEASQVLLHTLTHTHTHSHISPTHTRPNTQPSACCRSVYDSLLAASLTCCCLGLQHIRSRRSSTVVCKSTSQTTRTWCSLHMARSGSTSCPLASFSFHSLA